jgi:hypothetical protein
MKSGVGIEMMFRIDGEFMFLRSDAFYGGTHVRGLFEYLYRLPDKRWFLHSLNMATLAEPSFVEIAEHDAVAWLIRTRRAEELAGPEVRGTVRIAPQWVLPHEEAHRHGSMQYSCPPPIGQHVAVELPKISRPWDEISQRQSIFLEPGMVLENVMWPAMADISRTAQFQTERHDPLVTRLLGILEASLLERPKLSILQSLQDRGCDLLIEWSHRGKYGVQLKSNGDVEEKDFPTKTLAQIQDSQQHGLQQLFILFAADITGNSNSQKVRGMESRISSMNTSYARVVPPERAWTLLFAA